MADSKAVRTLEDIPGWFPQIDQQVFEHFLSDAAVVARGDLVELGVYLGKSAALIAGHKRAEETFTVCDLFGATSDDDANRRENAKSYAALDRESFERNFLALRDSLPVIVQDLSSTIVDHVPPGSVRFLHVDASHLYDHVVTDVESAYKLLLPEAVVVFDDYRSSHTPGVSAAVWEAVFTRGLQPICLTDQKMYGTFGDRAPHQQRLLDWLSRTPEIWCGRESIAGSPVLRLARQTRPKAPSTPAGTPESVGPRLKALEDRLSALDKRVGRLDAAARRPTVARRVARWLATSADGRR